MGMLYELPGSVCIPRHLRAVRMVLNAASSYINVLTPYITLCIYPWVTTECVKIIVNMIIGPHGMMG